ncbi:MAG TPA: GWxTD domain-containing protein [bacterium]|nr:GWxTD domain-containing protein [bacterium]HQG44078.1 GWxTD domain-containing protein [bacterium]HQI47783.1 GWxTD domain-containing protein [bacterium]HQJ63213.1 GWxTD domain-containing protein [bacterium]
MRVKIKWRPAITGIFLALAALLQPAAGQETQKSEPQFRFNIDYARSYYSDSLTYCELYAVIPRKQLTYLQDQGRFKAEFKATAEVFRQDSLVGSKIWRNVNYVDSLADISGDQSLFCLNHFILPDGDYTLAFTIEDLHSGTAKGTYRFPLQIAAFKGPGLELSDLHISGSIIRDTTASPFFKNGFQVTPNPSGLFGLGLPILYLYSEIYHLAPASSDSGGKYRVAYKIYNAEGQAVKEVAPRMRNKPGDSAVEVTGINVVTLVSGAYRVVEEVTDLETGLKATGLRKFFVYREGDFAGEAAAPLQKPEEIKGAGSAGIDADRYQTMGEKEINQEFDYTRYISTKEERNTFKKLNLPGKRAFMKEFWSGRDPSPGTPENEYKQDYLARVQKANTSYRGSFREGWRTDRGRILLVYGAPDEVERFPFSNDNRAYEIWHYYSVQGGVQFYFVDKRDTGDLELVHSTARGEIYDEDWEHWKNPSN